MSALKKIIYEKSETLQNLAPEKFASEQLREFGPQEVIFREGDDSREMFIVVAGEVEIFKTSGRGEVKLARMIRGDFIGEMSLLESLPRSASARALTAVKLLAIHPGGFLLKIRRDPTFAFELMQALSRRIRITNDSLIRALAKGESTEAIRAIVNGGEYKSSTEGEK